MLFLRIRIRFVHLAAQHLYNGLCRTLRVASDLVDIKAVQKGGEQIEMSQAPSTV